VAAVGDVFVERLEHLWEASGEEAGALPGGGIRNFWFVALNNFAFLGAAARDDLRARELSRPFQEAIADVPGGIFVIRQAGLFEEGLEEGRAIDIELTGPDLEHLLGLGLEVFVAVNRTLSGSQARPIPGLDLGNPEVQVRTHRRRAAELGISNRDLGFAVNALVDGVKASDYQYQGKEIDLVIKAEEGYTHRTHLLEQLPIAAPDGRLVTLGSVADLAVVSGPVQIDHSERQRAVTIRVSPEERMALETAMTTIENAILGPMRESGKLGGLYRATLSGSAAKLSETWDTLKWNFLLALVITYLLMAALFESFLYPLVIMFSVPLAALGGFLGLRVINLFQYQALDVLTMLGFIILIGTVVNNAILIVHQSLNQMRLEGMAPREAIREAVRLRIRPIFMSVSTSVFGMLPLVLFPGAGSELYRGLGSVVVGGLVVSTLFTIFLVPAVFSLSLDVRASVVGRIRGLVGREHPQPAADGRR
jgi:HAE1 family hydrophobic/amphiphilic exporter-1